MGEAAQKLIENMSAFGIEIDESQICIIKGGTSKHDALETLITAVSKNPVVQDAEAFRRAVFEREAVMSTGIGGGVAIPHVRIPGITAPTLGIGIAPKGVEYNTLDNKPVQILVLFATPEGADKEYLSLLAQVMMSLRSEELFDGLTECRTPTQVHALLND